jgi:DNA repair exonuclease SbcCD ATPase subunit
MKLIELKSENFKRLNAHVVMDGKSVTVDGKNGVGKSTFIDAVWIALTGKDIPEKPIQNGKDSAQISATIKSEDGSEFIVERKFTKSGGTLTAKTKDGAKFSSPQKFLDEKIGRISFDPFEFVNKPPREQKRFLMELLGIDLTDIEAEKKALLAEKENLSKEYQAAKKQLDSYPDFTEKLEEKSAAEVIEKFNAVNAEREEIKEKRARLDNLNAKAESLFNQRQSLYAQINAIEAESEKITAEASLLLKENSFELPEVTDIQAELKTINEHNEKVKIQKQREEKLNELSEIEESGKQKKRQLEKLEDERNKIISSAKMPIEGLSFDEDGLLFDGLPLTEQQLSTAKLIEIGVRISIALNPSLRIMKVKDASLLDTNTLNIIKNIAKDNEYQLFIEKVSDNEEIGFSIEDLNTQGE